MITEWRFSAVRYAVLIHKIFNSLSTKGTSLPYKMAFCKNSLRHQTESSLVEGNINRIRKNVKNMLISKIFACSFVTQQLAQYTSASHSTYKRAPWHYL